MNYEHSTLDGGSTIVRWPGGRPSAFYGLRDEGGGLWHWWAQVSDWPRRTGWADSESEAYDRGEQALIDLWVAYQQATGPGEVLGAYFLEVGPASIIADRLAEVLDRHLDGIDLRYKD